MKKNLYTLGEEIFNSVSHGIGTLLAVAALTLVSMFAARSGDVLCIVSAIIYGISLVVLYLMSTLYHAFSNKRVKHIFRIFDHCSIFVLIAGTYTPYLMVTMRDQFGWLIMIGVWSVAILGVVLNSVNVQRFKYVSLACYILIGWSAILLIKPLIGGLVKEGIYLMVAGGIAYTAGVAFYLLKRFKYMHSIWHLFVMLGSALHFFSILFYVY